MPKNTLFRSLLAFFLLSQSALAGEIERILSMVDYVGGDYSNAVSEGRVIDEFEYAEMADFSSAIIGLWEKTAEKKNAESLSGKFVLLKSLVASKAPVSEVETLAGELKGEIVSVYGLRPYPPDFPDYEAGKAVYGTHCSSCHGVSGKGDGVLSENLEPPATDLTDDGVKPGLSPFKVYNTVTFGIEGTAMASFDRTLGEKEKWDAAFYVLSLGYPDGGLGDSLPETAASARDLENLSAMSNRELLSAAGVDAARGEAVLSYLRTTFVRERTEEGFSDAIAHTAAQIDRALDLYESGRKDEAFSEVIDGYLGGFQRVEPALLAKKKPLVREVERKMGLLRARISSERDVSELRELGASIEKDLREAESVLSGGSSLGGYVSFAGSFAIITREALEALLIIAAIIAFLVHSGNRPMVRYVHFGWAAAVGAGVLTWFAAGTLVEISGARREIVEGATSLLAAAVLFYVSYWLVSKADAKQWKEYVKSKTEGAVGGRNGLALVSVSFLAVYREAFETMLFYQALFYHAGDSSGAQIVYGFAAGVAVVLLAAFAMYRFALRIPLKYFFSFTSAFLYLLCFILLGKGVAELQEAGIVSSTRADFLPYVDLLGVYPTYESALPQAALLLAALALALNVRARLKADA